MNLKIDLDIQNPCAYKTVPEKNDLESWVLAALQGENQEYSLVIRFVDEAEGLALNHTYRNKNSTTNVLSFPFEAPEFSEQIPELVEESGCSECSEYLGDLVLCEPVVIKEAKEQGKTSLEHWAHLIIHGTLHLQGFDHQDDSEANIMESLEVKILQNLGFNNPYE